MERARPPGPDPAPRREGLLGEPFLERARVTWRNTDTSSSSECNEPSNQPRLVFLTLHCITTPLMFLALTEFIVEKLRVNNMPSSCAPSTLLLISVSMRNCVGSPRPGVPSPRACRLLACQVSFVWPGLNRQSYAIVVDEAASA